MVTSFAVITGGSLTTSRTASTRILSSPSALNADSTTSYNPGTDVSTSFLSTTKLSDTSLPSLSSTTKSQSSGSKSSPNVIVSVFVTVASAVAVDPVVSASDSAACAKVLNAELPFTSAIDTLATPAIAIAPATAIFVIDNGKRLAFCLLSNQTTPIS